MNIMIFGGTTEGRELAQCLMKTRHKILYSAATEYGALLIPESGNLKVRYGRMQVEDMLRCFKEEDISMVLDATHPYAVLAGKTIRKAARLAGIRYLRIRRDLEASTSMLSGRDFRTFPTVKDAAEWLRHEEGKILITTGSKEIEAYTCIPDYKERCFVRALPQEAVLQKLKALGFPGKMLCLMQGPFSEDLNLALLKQTGARFLVSKNSGETGGFPEKCEAAIRAGAELLVIGAPPETDPFKPPREQEMTLIQAETYLRTI